MAAVILSSAAPQFGQRCMSRLNTRLSSRAQLMSPDRAWAVSTSRWAAAAASVAEQRKPNLSTQTTHQLVLVKIVKRPL